MNSGVSSIQPNLKNLEVLCLRLVPVGFVKGGGPGRGVPLLSNTRIECKKRGQKSLKIIENETSNDTTMIENEAMEGSGGL